MRGPWLGAVQLIALLAAFDATAAILIHPSAKARLAEQVWFDLSVTNSGDETARYLVPEVEFQGEAKRGSLLAALEGGAQHEWRLALPPPSSPGAFPLIVRVRYVDAYGRPLSTVLVYAVRTPDCPPAAVRLAFPKPWHIFIDRWALVRLLLENPGPTPLAGRVVTVLPAELRVQPANWPEEIPAEGRIEMPVLFENTAGQPGDFSDAYVIFEYDLGGFHQAVVEGAPVSVIDLSEKDGNRGWGPVVAVILLASVGLLGLSFYALGRRPWKRRGPATLV